LLSIIMLNIWPGRQSAHISWAGHKVYCSQPSVGITIWRVLVPLSISYISSSLTWRHGPSGLVYFSRLDDSSEKAPDEQMVEISARNIIDSSISTEKRFSYGIPAANERGESHFKVHLPVLLCKMIETDAYRILGL
jgi:hypothetical protein